MAQNWLVDGRDQYVTDGGKWKSKETKAGNRGRFGIVTVDISEKHQVYRTRHHSSFSKTSMLNSLVSSPHHTCRKRRGLQVVNGAIGSSF